MTILDEMIYWKLAAKMSRFNAEATRINAEISAARRQAYIEAGLDPNQVYVLNDADLSATPQDPDK